MTKESAKTEAWNLKILNEITEEKHNQTEALEAGFPDADIGFSDIANMVEIAGGSDQKETRRLLINASAAILRILEGI